jgi:catechol 2,3-dioxygenase-like lactoylglutathione lyase family enzyme
VDDLPACIDFYTQHLGVVLEYRATDGLAILTKDALRLLLTRPVSSNGMLASDEPPAPGGWNRIQVSVLDAAAMRTALRKAGQSLRGELVIGKAGRLMLVEDPSGNLVELYQAFHD